MSCATGGKRGMRKLVAFRPSLLAAVLFVAAVGTAASADTVAVRYWSNGDLVLVERSVPTGMDPAEAAVRALVAGPTQAEAAIGLASRIPPGVSIDKLSISDTSAEVDLSAGILTGLDEAGLRDIFDQFRSTLGDFLSIQSIRLTCDGKLLSSYLSGAPTVGGPAVAPISVSATGLGGHSITIGPSHGRYWVGFWAYQRGDPCGFGEAVLEDTNSIRLCQFLYTYLSQDGATVYSARQLDESDCCNSDTGLAWWKMCASTWLHHAGLPCSVWASSSDNCGADTATSRSSDDIRARPLYADYRGTEIYIAHHTNAGGGGTANGTETFRDTAMEHPAWVSASYNLASAVQNNVVSAIRTMYDGNWSSRGVKDSAGGFGEIRIPDRPACLIELAFHDNCSRDAAYLTDNFFRSVSEWGLYKGVCEYFGVTPTYSYYSYDVVSEDIPTTLDRNQVAFVHITLRNRGVLWNETRQFRLGAVGNSDPFTTQTRCIIPGEVGPNQTITFTFSLKAPNYVGIYHTDWRMLREYITWFGPTIGKDVEVVDLHPDYEPPTAPTNLTATLIGISRVDLSWTASTDNVGVVGYNIYRNSAIIATTTATTYSDTTISSGDTYVYEVSAYDLSENESAKSNTATVSTAVVTDFIIDNDKAIFPGTWFTRTDTTTKYGADYRYGGCSPSTGRIARWTPDIDIAGNYLVYVWYPQDTNRSIKAPYTVVYSGGLTTVQVNQTVNGGQWNLIATLPFAVGKTGYVQLGNGTGEPSTTVVAADAVRLLYLPPPDTTAPTIHSVDLWPSMVAGGAPVKVTVVATDNIAVTGVTASGTALALGGADSWTGSIDTDPTLGAHTVTILARDAADNQTTNTAKHYVTARVFGLANASLLPNGATQAAAHWYLFKTWGAVTVLDSDRFDCGDGSQIPVRIYCPSHGLTTGRFVSVFGIWNCSTGPPQLEAQPGQIRTIH